MPDNHWLCDSDCGVGKVGREELINSQAFELPFILIGCLGRYRIKEKEREKYSLQVHSAHHGKIGQE